MESLRHECHQRGKQLPYRLFERYDLSDDAGRPTYQALAAEFGITTATATNYLAAMRRRLRQIVLERIRDTTSTDREFRHEVRALLGIEV